MDLTDSKDFLNFVEEIKNKVKKAQYAALKKVNKELINLYWSIGQDIVVQQEENTWGDSVVDGLSKELQREFEGIRGFSRRNLYLMREFYLTYRNDVIVQPLVAQIGWTHNILILYHCNEKKERGFYIKMTLRHGWSKYSLKKNLKQDLYRRWLLNQQNFNDTVDKERVIEATLAVKDDYNFDFLGVDELPGERALEHALVDNILDFLKEMGSDFTFVARQHKLVVSEDEYYVDLLFFHRRLKSLIAVELKVDEFKPEFAGKMQFYLSALDEQTRIEGENPSIGIIICKTKDRTKVEYTLKDVKRPVGVASYNQYENLNDMPATIARYLPDELELEKKLSQI